MKAGLGRDRAIVLMNAAPGSLLVFVVNKGDEGDANSPPTPNRRTQNQTTFVVAQLSRASKASKNMGSMAGKGRQRTHETFDFFSWYVVSGGQRPE